MRRRTLQALDSRLQRIVVLLVLIVVVAELLVLGVDVAAVDSAARWLIVIVVVIARTRVHGVSRRGSL